MGFNGQGAMAGAASGAAVGSIVPGYGTAIGAGVGLLAGGFMGGSGSSPNFDALINQRDQELRQRRADINNFAGQLATSRQNYIANLQNLNRTSLNMFSPDLESQLGGKNIDIHGGAFSSALARASTQLNMSALQNAYGMEHQDLTNQMGLLAGQGSLAEFQSPLAMAQYNNQTGQQNSMMGGLGQLAGSALNYQMNKNLIASMAQLRTPTSNTQAENPNPAMPKPNYAYGNDMMGYGV